MSKAIHWTLPFTDRNGVAYRIDIYDTDYTGAPVTILGGNGVFDTDESSSEDVFEPVRSSTGTLHVFDENGTLMEQLMPRNNTDRPVRLVRTSDGKVMWQGFLSCEVYSQNYTGRPQVVDIPVNSMLQSMDSIRMTVDNGSTNRIIRMLFATIINKTSEKAGFNIYENIAYPAEGYRIFENLMDISCLFSRKEIANEGGVSYQLDGISLKEVFSRLCAFMGWTARERGTTLYLEPLMETMGVHVTPYAYFASPRQQDRLPYGLPTSQEKQMSSFVWAGDSHRKSINQGAKSVEVAANLEQYEASLSIPDCPDTQLAFRKIAINNSSNEYVYQLCDTSGNLGSLLDFQFFTVTVTENKKTTSVVPGGTYSTLYQATTIGSPQFFIDWPRKKRAGCFFCKYGTAKDNRSPSYVSALFLAGNYTEDFSQFPPSESNYILKMRSDMVFSASDGYIVMNSSAMGVTHEQRYIEPFRGTIPASIKFGDYYWNGSTWTVNFAYIMLEFNNGTIKSNYVEGETKAESSNGFYIPIDQMLDGELCIMLYPYIHGKVIHNLFNYYFMDLMFSQLSLEYYPIFNSKYSDRSVNKYYKLIDTDFSREESIQLDLATNLNNKRSPSIILGISMEPVSSITYSVPGGTEDKRPENVLLGKMERYYNQSRRLVSIVVEHPSEDLPLTTITGFDGRRYAPLAESIQWQQATSEITCFEVPE